MDKLSLQSSVDCDPNTKPIRKKRTSVNLSHSKRESVYLTLESMMENGHLPRCARIKVAKMFGTNKQTVGRIWSRGRESLSNTTSGVFDVSSWKKSSGRKPKYQRSDLGEKLRELPLRSRRTSRDSAVALGISQGLFFYLMKKYKIFRAATLAAKPTLTPKHRSQRVSFVQQNRSEDTPSHFDPQFQTIHFDEKRFLKEETRLRAYWADDEEAIAETVQHKAHIEKVMFLAAVARPRRFRQRWGSEQVSVDIIDGELVTNLFGPNNSSLASNSINGEDDSGSGWYFNGKVGLYPIVETTFAIRNSVNRKKGTPVLKPISMTAAVYRDFILNKLLPDIVKNCPPEMRLFPILIQHDIAPPHKINNEVFNSHCLELAGCFTNQHKVRIQTFAIWVSFLPSKACITKLLVSVELKTSSELWRSHFATMTPIAWIVLSWACSWTTTKFW
jgi:hypothetical protein